jgi:hypothetical protein
MRLTAIEIPHPSHQKFFQLPQLLCRFTEQDALHLVTSGDFSPVVQSSSPVVFNLGYAKVY